MYPILQLENGKYRIVGKTSIPQQGFMDAENFDKKSGLIPLKKNQREKYASGDEEFFDINESGELVKLKK